MPSLSANLVRFVVLRHEGIESPHFDLMFERTPGSALATWRSEAWPLSVPLQVELLPDHRGDYLDYEGPVSGNRGSVHRLAAGTCIFHEETSSMIAVHFSDAALGGLLFWKRDERWHAIPISPIQ